MRITNTLKHAALCAALGALGATVSTGTLAAECSADDWSGCKGKPWVTGEKMETPIGER